MIDELTPFILRTAAQAGGPVTVDGLMERLRLELSDRTITRHLADLVNAGRLQIGTISEGRQITVIPAPGQLSPAPPPTFFGGQEPRRPVAKAPSRQPLQARAAIIAKRLADAANRDHKRPRSTPRRATVLALLNQEPMTISDVASELRITLGASGEHITALRQSGLVVRYAQTRSPSGNRTTLWVSTELRLLLPGPPPCPPPPQRRRNRRVPADAAVIGSATS